MNKNKCPKIMIIRHGEKPPKDGGDPQGVTLEGHRDDDSLSPRGWQRAGALVTLFTKVPWHRYGAGIEMPAHLYAFKPSKSVDPSRRSIETITPLSELLNLRINQDFVMDQTKELIEHVKQQNGPVLIAWDHHAIPDIGNKIQLPESAAYTGPAICPQKWNKKRFDLVWIFDLDPVTNAYKFTQVPQMLLAGDFEKVMK